MALGDILAAKLEAAVGCDPAHVRRSYLPGHVRGALFLNLSRVALVDEYGLVASLDAGHLGRAVLDVDSAPDEMSPSRFFSHPYVVATRHGGGAMRKARGCQRAASFTGAEREAPPPDPGRPRPDGV